ncbi:ferritin-like domain-containing protein [Paraburkholderia sp. SIMBA_054]|uniref:YciE/YciF ferroxidase family protein n=1 Tax=Paraburkholderia sp. SIMBA_054 TaxID=3085795 RepID=UPI003978A0E3
MEQKTRPRNGRTGRIRRKALACPPIGALMRYGERIVRVVAEASGQRVIIQSVNEDGCAFRSTVKWASLTPLDTALIASAQRVEHYEIAAYGSLIALGKQLGETTAVQLLGETLKEEKSTDEKLSLLAEEKVAAEALGK